MPTLKLLPLPSLQVEPLSVLNCHLAPASRPETVAVPSLLMRSVLLLPVSLKLAPKATGAVWSMLKTPAFCAVRSTSLTVCLIWTWPAA